MFHPGSQLSQQTALAFQEAGQLAWYATSLPPETAWPFRARPHRTAVADQAHALDPASIRPIGAFGLMETAVRQFAGSGVASWLERRVHDRFMADLQSLLQAEPVDVVWGYEGYALDGFRWAKHAGLRCVLDQRSAHRKTKSCLLQEERARHPDFFAAENASVDSSTMAVQDEELALADLVIVGSEFCRQSLRENGCAEDKIRIVPYGYDDTAFPIVLPPRVPLSGRPARFLFVGELSAARGIAYLLKAFRTISPERARLTLVGPLHMPPITFAHHAAHVIHFSKLSRDAVIGQLFSADALIFPSLFDEGDVTLYEALGAGLGIIQSANADIPTVHGRNGIVLERLTVDMLANAIDVALTPAERLAQWCRESWHMRPERSWNTYRRAIQRTGAAL